MILTVHLKHGHLSEVLRYRRRERLPRTYCSIGRIRLQRVHGRLPKARSLQRADRRIRLELDQMTRPSYSVYNHPHYNY